MQNVTKTKLRTRMGRPPKADQARVALEPIDKPLKAALIRESGMLGMPLSAYILAILTSMNQAKRMTLVRQVIKGD